jgi:thermitase
LQTAVQYAIDQGVVVVAAVGNNNTDQPFYPVAYPGVIGVTAVDADNHKAAFANYGASWVDLAAPGVGITSTIIGSQGSGYASWSGTSMSTAFVSGAAALLQQKMPGASVTTTLEVLRTHGADLDPINPAYAGQIGRMLDLATALNGDTPTATPSPMVSPTPTLVGTPLSTVTAPAPTITPSPVTTPIGGGGASRQYLPLVLR